MSDVFKAKSRCWTSTSPQLCPSFMLQVNHQLKVHCDPFSSCCVLIFVCDCQFFSTGKFYLFYFSHSVMDTLNIASSTMAHWRVLFEGINLIMILQWQLLFHCVLWHSSHTWSLFHLKCCYCAVLNSNTMPLYANCFINSKDTLLCSYFILVIRNCIKDL